MREVSREFLLDILDGKFEDTTKRGDKALIDLKNISIKSMNLDGVDFSNVDLSWSEIVDTSMKNAKFEKSILDNVSCRNTDFSYSNFNGASLKATDFRTCKLDYCQCLSTDFAYSILLDASMEGIKIDKNTKHYSNECPEKGCFIGYKKCFNDLLVTLLIPSDARRSSGTNPACRCDKAKVIAITNLDGSGFYNEANSLVDENFIYRLGQYSYADGFEENRWLDSSHGIHFWMSKEEAIAY